MSKKRFAHIEIGLLLSLVVGAVFIVVAMIVVLLVNHHARQQALTEATSKACILLSRNLATHTYFSHDLKPSLFEWTEPFRSDDYFDPTWMSSTYAVREIDEYFKSLNPADYYYKECAINARSPENEADAYERAFLDELNANPDLTERSVVRTLDGKPYFVTLRRGEVMEEACLRCHGTPDEAPRGLIDHYGSERSFGREVGDVVSAISIRVPLSAAYAGANRVSLQLSASLLLLLVCFFGFQWLLNKRLLFTPLSRIRDKALQILTGGEHLGEKIPVPFGKELSELTTAFNMMSVRLRRNRDHLEERVGERTAELTTANDQLEGEIAERVRAEREIEERRRYLEGMLNAAPDAIVTLDARHRIVEWNPGAERLFGYSPEEAVGQNIDDLVTEPDVLEEAVGYTQIVTSGGEVPPTETVRYRKDGSPVDVIVAGSPIMIEDELIGAVAVYTNITERVRMEEALRALALLDELTGLYNRRGFSVLAEHQLKMAERGERRMLLLFADLDGLKWINDTFGHSEGDRALIETADILEKTFRESDIVARIGGDEFVVLAIETNGSPAEVLISRLRENLKARNAEADCRYKLSLSVGLARYDPTRPCSLDDLLARADRAMYEQKRGSGKS
jgi:diguanylate cyclase (GGDEF)-like protein/PAS domain S-box-containing protein